MGNNKKKTCKIISTNKKLHALLEKTGHFSYIGIGTKLDLEANYINILIIDDEIISVNELNNYKRSLGNVEKVFYISKDTIRFSNIKPLLVGNGIIPIPPVLTDEQIVQKILKSIANNISGYTNIFSFLGADNGVGTTMVAQSVAEQLAKTDKRVCLLFLNGKPSTDYIKNQSISEVGLDGIKTKITNDILSEEELISMCVKEGNLYILPGASKILDVCYYHPEDIEKLLKLSSRVFDIVIVDSGCNPHFDIQMGIASLNCSNKRFLVTTQSDKVKNNFKRIFEQVLKPLDFKIDDFWLIINKYIDSVDGYLDIQLAKMYNMIKVSSIPYLDNGLLAEKEKTSLLKLNNFYFTDAINQICKVIMAELGFQPNILFEQDKSKGFFSFLLKKGR